MKIITEGRLQFDFSAAEAVLKFDDTPGARKVSYHYMSAVDFIVTHDENIYFIEVKDPDDPDNPKKNDIDFISSYLSNDLEKLLIRKFRDTFIYRWAEKSKIKEIIYVVLISFEALNGADLGYFDKRLKSNLPLIGPIDGSWKRNIAKECVVLNLSKWIDYLPQFPISQIH